MIFDKFCAIIERQLPEHRKVAEEAKLFVFDKIPHHVLPKKGEADYEEIKELFTLPFPITAIEDPASLIILMDKKNNQIGVNEERFYIEVSPIFKDNDNYNNTEGQKIDQAHFDKMKSAGIDNSACVVVFGEIKETVWSKTGFNVRGDFQRFIIVDKNKIYADDLINEEFKKNTINDKNNSLKNAMTAFQELMCIYTKKSFVLEMSPIEGKSRRSHKKILRSHQRPTYTILDAREIRQKLDLYPNQEPTTSGRKSPIPHERRRHPRRISADKGHFKQDKVIIIPATWIGESEKIIGNKRYKVRLDI